MTYNPRINNLDGGVVQVSGTLSTDLYKIQSGISIVTSSVSLTDSDYVIFADASSNNLTLTLPPASTAPGLNYKFKKIDNTSNSVNLNTKWIEFLVTSSTDNFFEISNDFFGSKVTINDVGNLIAGASRYSDFVSGSDGSISIFRSSSISWYREAVLTASLAISSSNKFGDFFPDSIKFNSSGNILAAGWGDGVGNLEPQYTGGLVFIYRSGSTGWQEETFLKPTGTGNILNFFGFGYHVAINSVGDRIAGAAPYIDFSESNYRYAGALIVFQSSSTGWHQEAFLTASLDAVPGYEYMGEGNDTVAINDSGDLIAIGSQYYDRTSTQYPGAIIIFRSSSIGWRQEIALTSSGDGSPSADYLGNAVSMNSTGDIVIAGSDADSPTTDAGAVTVFRSSSIGWRQEAFLTSSGDGTPAGDKLGSSVSINKNGDMIVAGSLSDNPRVNSGAITIYRSSSVGWKQESRLTSSGQPNISGEAFGYYSVGINKIGDTVIGGSPFLFFENSSSQGAIIVYNSSSLNSWQEATQLTSSNPFEIYINQSNGGDEFGAAVDINDDGNVIVIGSPTSDLPNGGAGGLFMFRKLNNVWMQEAYLTSSGDGYPGDGIGFGLGGSPVGDQLGYSVAINSLGDLVFGGSPRSDSPTGSAGAVIVFRSSSIGWRQEAFLTSSGDGSPENDLWGWSVDCNSSGNKLVIGSQLSDLPVLDTGGIIVFESSSIGWRQEAFLTSSGDGSPSNDNFARVIKINKLGNIIVAGSYNSDLPAINAGAVTVFRSSSIGWRQEAFLTSSGDGDTSYDILGVSVSINRVGNVIAAGSSNSDLPTGSAGAVVVFRSSSIGWRQEAFLTSSGDGTPYFQSLGNTVVLNDAGDLIAASTNDGAVIFRSSSVGWQQKVFITSSNIFGGGFGSTSYPNSFTINNIGNIFAGGIPGKALQSGTITYPSIGALLVFEKDTIDGDDSDSLSISTPNESLGLISDGTSSWKII